jgi:hypothetical protein
MLHRASWHEAFMCLPTVHCKPVCGGPRRHSAMLQHPLPFASLFLVCFACIYAPDCLGELSCTHVPQCGVVWGCQLLVRQGLVLSAVRSYTLRTVFEVGLVFAQCTRSGQALHAAGTLPMPYGMEKCLILCVKPAPAVLCSAPKGCLRNSILHVPLLCVSRRSGTVA